MFAAEAALTTLTMATSNYVVAELMDRFGLSPRLVTAGVGTFFLMPGIIWFATQKWWDQKEKHPAVPQLDVPTAVETERIEV